MEKLEGNNREFDRSEIQKREGLKHENSSSELCTAAILHINWLFENFKKEKA